MLRKWGRGYHRSIAIKRPIGNAFDGRDVTVLMGVTGNTLGPNKGVRSPVEAPPHSCRGGDTFRAFFALVVFVSICLVNDFLRKDFFDDVCAMGQIEIVLYRRMQTDPQE